MSKKLVLAVLAALLALVLLATIRSQLAHSEGQRAAKLAKAHWENRNPFFYVDSFDARLKNSKSVTITRFRNELGLQLKQTRNSRFSSSYNSVIKREINENGIPNWLSSYVITDEQLAEALFSPRKELCAVSRDFGEYRIARDSDTGIVLHCKARTMGVDVGLDESASGYETWKSPDNAEIRFIRVGSWLGAIHKSGFMVAMGSAE